MLLKNEAKIKRLTSKDLVEVLVELEPVWQDTEHKKEHGQTKQKQAGHHT